MKPDFTSKTSNIRTATAMAGTTAAATDAQKTLPEQDAQEKYNVQSVHEAQKAEHARKTYSEEEKQEFLAAMKTAGRKGCRLPRINMAFAPELYDYVKTMSKVSGLTLTEFVNTVIKQYMDTHREQYDKALEFRNNL